ncbi:hypothetical protein CSIM01_03930 [Colletotrichum simmondsii]|uniref:Uncharacterized protein n=1 Tax=Colletotrichum simmondsii TaxID=703756 RepID=A0A135TNM1_9PEZI|nr:hypothetical protein CSIM01_03930 [Colletotrichum simmondsii]
MSTEDDIDSEPCRIRSGNDDRERMSTLTEGMEEISDIKIESTVDFPKLSCRPKDQTASDPLGSSPHIGDETNLDPRKSSSYLRGEIDPGSLNKSLYLDSLFASDHLNDSPSLETEVCTTSPKSSCDLRPEAIFNPEETTPRREDESTSNSLIAEPCLNSLKLSPQFENKDAYENYKFASRLESLPAELRFLLLSWMPDLPTLHNVINASPVLHAQYRKARDTLLFTCLSKELDGYYVDAFATLRSRVTILGLKRTDDMCEQFLSDDHDSVLSGKHTVGDFDRPRARPIARLYANWALGNLRQAVSSESQFTSGETSISTRPGADDVASLSPSEEIRIYRAIYRFETYCHLFGRNKGVRSYGFRSDKICDIFFGNFDPWDVEAFGSIYLFIKYKYERLFDEVKDDVADTNPRFNDRNSVLTPFDSWDLVTPALRNKIMNGTTARGLRPLLRLLRIDDHETLVNKMLSTLAMDRDIDECLEHVLDWPAQHERRISSPQFPTARDKLERAKTSMKFMGDNVPPLSPPLAWVLLWNGRYSNVFGGFVPEELRRWGYVMWDEQRWNEMGAGAKGLIREQWKSHHVGLIETLEAVYWGSNGNADDADEIADDMEE